VHAAPACRHPWSRGRSGPTRHPGTVHRLTRTNRTAINWLARSRAWCSWPLRRRGSAHPHLLEAFHHLRCGGNDRTRGRPGSGDRPIRNRKPGRSWQRRTPRCFLGPHSPCGVLPRDWFAGLQRRHGLAGHHGLARYHHPRWRDGGPADGLTGNSPQNFTRLGLLGNGLRALRFGCRRGRLRTGLGCHPGRLSRCHGRTRHTACGVLGKGWRRNRGNGWFRPFGTDHRRRQEICRLRALRLTRFQDSAGACGCGRWQLHHGRRWDRRRLRGTGLLNGTLCRRLTLSLFIEAKWRVLRIRSLDLYRRGKHRCRTSGLARRLGVGFSRRERRRDRRRASPQRRR
jgi:hypothetical protein